MVFLGPDPVVSQGRSVYLGHHPRGFDSRPPQVNAYTAFLTSVCLCRLHGQPPWPLRPCITISPQPGDNLDNPAVVWLPPLSPVVHSLLSSQSGQALPSPLNPLCLEVGSRVASALEPATQPGPLPSSWQGAALRARHMAN